MSEHEPIDLSHPDHPDLHGSLARLRQDGPVAAAQLFGHPAFLLTTHEATAAALADEDRFSAIGGPQRDDPYIGRVMTSYDYEEHRLHRRLTARALRSREVLGITEHLADDVAGRLVAQLPDEIDLMEDYAIPFSYRVVARLIGVGSEDEGEVAGLGRDLIEIGADPDRARAASVALGERFGRMVDAAMSSTGDGPTLVEQLVAAEVDGKRLDREDVISFCRLMFGNGADSTSHGLGILLAFALDNPSDFASASVHAVLTECLRWEPPVPAVIRQCRQDTVFAGEEIPGGSIVLFGIAAANRDPAVFDRPDEFDPARGSTPCSRHSGSFLLQ